MGRHRPKVYEALSVLVALVVGALTPAGVSAEIALELPAISAAGHSPDDAGMFSVRLLWWDQASTPNPIVLKRGTVIKIIDTAFSWFATPTAE